MLTWKTYVSTKSRAWRAQLFKQVLNPPDDASLLDLGGGKGTHMARFYPAAKNVHIADFNPEALAYARANYGFTPHLVDGGNRLPFSDGQFDVVFCSSVIEHVTGEKHAAARTFRNMAGSSRPRPTNSRNGSRPKSVASASDTSSRPRRAVSQSKPIAGYR